MKKLIFLLALTCSAFGATTIPYHISWDWLNPKPTRFWVLMGVSTKTYTTVYNCGTNQTWPLQLVPGKTYFFRVVPENGEPAMEFVFKAPSVRIAQ